MTGFSSSDDEHPFPWLPSGPTLLFAPTDRPECFQKAAERSDMVITDLEGGAAVDNHEQARANIINNPLDPEAAILRITGPGTPTFAEDVTLARTCDYDIVMMSEARGSILAELEGLEIIAIIETPQVMINIQQIATYPDVVGLFWGAEDLTAELGGVPSRQGVDENPRRHYRDPQRLARALVQVHAAAAGITAIDAVHTDFHDGRSQYLEAFDAVGCGFLATACIHPAMVSPVRETYKPSEATLARARKIVDHAGTHTGTFQLNGEMIDAPVVKQAVAALAHAGISE